MKWLIIMLIAIPFYINAQAAYTEDDYKMFKYVMLIGQEIWSILKEKEARYTRYNKKLTKALNFMHEVLGKIGTKDSQYYRDNISTARNGLKTLIKNRNQKVSDRDLIISDDDLYNVAFTYYYKIPLLQIEDMREYGPCFDTSAEKTYVGFFLEFEECLSIKLWTPWGKLLIAKNYIEDEAVSLPYRERIIEALSATKCTYGDTTLYTLHRIIKNGYNGIDLPTAVLSDQPAHRPNEFYEKWYAMQEKWQRPNTKEESSQEFKSPVLDLPNIESPRQKREELRKTLPRYEKPVLSLMHLT